jgi:2-polyprenyl-3-methyl-5-hydroxy-6-metoxy-1,4-benzoquinol methylase
MSGEPSQLHTWSHFQNEATEVFRANHPRLRYLLRTARGHFGPSGGTLLDVGVGDGYLEVTAREQGWQVRAIDPDPLTVDKLRHQGIDAVAGTIAALPFADATFDVTITSEVLEHLTAQDRAQGMAEIARTLKVGGTLIGSVPYREDLQMNTDVCPNCRHVFHRWGHTTSFDLEDVRTLLSTHFAVTTCRRTAFVEFTGPWRGKLVSLARLAGAKLGMGSPSIFFVGRKRSQSSGAR